MKPGYGKDSVNEDVREYFLAELRLRDGNGKADEGEQARSNIRLKSTCIRASERRAVRAQLRSLEPTSQWAAGGHERRSGNP